MSKYATGVRKFDDEEEWNDERDAMLYEIEANLEKKLAILNQVDNLENDEEESSRQLLEMPAIDPFTYSIPSVSQNDILQSACLDQHAAGDRKFDDEEEPNDVRDAMLYEIEANLEKKLAILNHIGTWEDDEEESSRQLLEMPTFGPFTYSLDSIPSASQNDILQSACLDQESCCRRKEVLRNFFIRWSEDSLDPASWVNASDLLLMFKFALRRPLMAKSMLWTVLQDLGFDPNSGFLDDLVVGDAESTQRSRDTRGLSPEGTPDISSFENHHLEGLGLSHEGLESEVESGDQEYRGKEKIAELATYLDMYRSAKFDTPQVVSLIHNLLGDTISHESIRSSLSFELDQLRKPLSMACFMWEKFLLMGKGGQEDQTAEIVPDELFRELCDEIFNPTTALDDPAELFRSVCKSIEFSEVEKSYVLRTFDVPQDLFKVESASIKASATEIAAIRETYEKKPRSSTKGLSKPADLRCNPTTTLALPCSLKTPMRKSAQHSSAKSNGTKDAKQTINPLLILNSPMECNDHPDVSSDATMSNTSSSPEDGVSDALFGLPLSTKKARDIGMKLKLPQDYQDQIRSTTPNRNRRRKRRKYSTRVTFPNKKPKISYVASAEQNRIVTSNLSLGLFARDGEDARTFVQLHINAHIMKSIYSTRERFLRKLLQKDASKSKPASPQDTELDTKQQALLRPNTDKSQKVGAHIDPERPVQNNSDLRKMNGSLLESNDVDEWSTTSAQASDGWVPLPIMSAFPSYKSLKEVIPFLRHLDAIQELDSKSAAWYHSCYFVFYGVKNCVLKHPVSDEEKEMYATVSRLTGRFQKIKTRLPFLNLVQPPVKALARHQDAASFQNELGSTKCQSFFNGDVEMSTKPEFKDDSYSRPMLVNPIAEGGGCPPSRSCNILARSGLRPRFPTEEEIPKSARRRMLLVDGSLRKNSGGIRRFLRDLNGNASIENAENIANEDRIYFQSSNGTPGVANITNALNKLFERYRDNPVQEPDSIGVEGSMRYLGDLGVKLDEAVLLAVLTELSAPTMGELSRQGFVEGWKTYHADSLSKQQTIVTTFRRSLSQTPDFFKRVYKNTFLLARNPGQKSLALDVAVEYWRLLLQTPSNKWNTDSTPWLDWWIAYLQEVWKKGISKDMWDQTGVFIQKSQEDGSMAWWSEDGAWPGAIDEFVGFVKEKRKAAAEGGGLGADRMDVA